MFTGSFAELALAALAFTGGHFLFSSTGLRPALVARLGENGFRGAFSLFSAATLAWLIWSYVAAPFAAVWEAPVWARHLSLTIMPFVLILFVAAMRKDNPTSVTGTPDDVDPGRLGVFSVTRHPMMWAFGLWALLHMLANPDVASLLFFGAFAVLALAGTVAIDAKKRAGNPVKFQELAARTSNIPFAAIIARRTRFSGHRLLLPTVVGLVLYGLLLWLHPWLFGADPLAL